VYEHGGFVLFQCWIGRGPGLAAMQQAPCHIMGATA
jgi:hypothetical protein